MPVFPAYTVELDWQQPWSLLSRTEADHPLGRHRPRIPDQVVLEKLVQVLVCGCAYERIADESCSVTTLHRGRDGWIEAGSMEAIEEVARSLAAGACGVPLRIITAPQTATTRRF